MILSKRLCYGVLALIGLSMLMFYLVRVMPGDPIGLVLGPMAKEDAVQKLRHEMGLDRPIHVQYYRYVEGIFHQGKLGMSLVERRDVSDVIAEKLPATMEIIMAAIMLAVILGVPRGERPK